jgi:hypothetical protein
VIAALETAAHPHHTEANPEMVSRAMTMTATASTPITHIGTPPPMSA